MTDLNAWLMASQNTIRIGCFVFFFLVLASAESFWTWRQWRGNRWLRWGRHFGLSLISKIALRVAFPLLLLETALEAEKHQQGILSHTALPFWAKVILGIIALDVFIYLQHRMMHRFKWFWFCHRVHHVDKHLDVSTGIRFHPFEELISMAVKLLGVVFWGVPVLGALIFEVLLNFASLFTHVNVRLPKKIEKILRYVIVTPDMHRIHHSDNPQEYNSNYGFGLSLWDRWFNTNTP